MSTPHSFIHRRNISIAWRTKKKKKKNENMEKIGEKKKNRIEMNVYEREMGRYKLCLSTTNTREDGVGGIWINKTQSSGKKLLIAVGNEKIRTVETQKLISEEKSLAGGIRKGNNFVLTPPRRKLRSHRRVFIINV